jgi:hypothetical protein
LDSGGAEGERVIDPIDPFQAIEWGVSALLALGAALIALKTFRLSPVWSLVIGMAVFTVLHFPITTHAVKVDLPRPSN